MYGTIGPHDFGLSIGASGQLMYGLSNANNVVASSGFVQIITSKSYGDDQWHRVTAHRSVEPGSSLMAFWLEVDGEKVGEFIYFATGDDASSPTKLQLGRMEPAAVYLPAGSRF